MNNDKPHSTDWKLIFDDASIPPPNDLWAKVERALDEEKAWKSSFVNAEISPSPELWQKIEAALQPKKRRPFVFWLSANSLKIAAGLLFALVSYQLLFISHEKNENQPLGNKQQATATITQEPNQLALGQSTIKDKLLGKTSKGVELAMQSGNKTANELSINNEPTHKSITENKVLELGIIEPREVITCTQQIPELLEPNVHDWFGDGKRLSAHQASFVSHFSGLPAIVTVPEHQTSKANKKEYWFAVASGVSPFNPNLSFGGVSMAAMAAFEDSNLSVGGPSLAPTTNGSPPSYGKSSYDNTQKNESQTGQAVQFGVLVGMKIYKNWTLEGGVQVLRGSSSLLTNTYLINRNTSQKNTFYDVATTPNTESMISMDNVAAVLNDETYQNNYTFIQFPVRVGYQVWNNHKFSASVLGGMSVDVFSSNTFTNAAQNSQSVILAHDETNPYRHFNTSALAGLRLHYQLYKNWRIQVGTQYQHALLPSNKPDALFGAKMNIWGMSTGINYKF